MKIVSLVPVFSIEFSPIVGYYARPLLQNPIGQKSQVGPVVTI